MFAHNVGRTQVLVGKFFISVEKRNARLLTARKIRRRGLVVSLGRARRREPNVNRYQLSSSLSLAWQSGSVSCEVQVGHVLPTEG